MAEKDDVSKDQKKWGFKEHEPIKCCINCIQFWESVESNPYHRFQTDFKAAGDYVRCGICMHESWAVSQWCVCDRWQDQK